MIRKIANKCLCFFGFHKYIYLGTQQNTNTFLSSYVRDVEVCKRCGRIEYYELGLPYQYYINYVDEKINLQPTLDELEDRYVLKKHYKK